MTRASQSLSIFSLVSAIYFAFFLELIPVFSQKVRDEIIPVLPLWALVTFGAYLLSSLGWSLLTFNDVPEAHARLMNEIEVARTDLKRRGVEVD